MYLKEIIFNGFKSFADSTKVELNPGVTTIVGPNPVVVKVISSMLSVECLESKVQKPSGHLCSSPTDTHHSSRHV